MKDLNELLKQRAEEKLNLEIKKYLKDFRYHKFFGAFGFCPVNINEEGKTENLSSFFENEYRTAGKLIRAAFLPEYIEKETKDFMEKVDAIESEIEDLKGSINER